MFEDSHPVLHGKALRICQRKWPTFYPWLIAGLTLFITLIPMQSLAYKETVCKSQGEKVCNIKRIDI